MGRGFLNRVKNSTNAARPVAAAMEKVLKQPVGVVNKTGAAGAVVDGSINVDTATGTVTFSVADAQTEVPIVYHGSAPDTLRDEGEAVVEGALGPDGVFVADTLFAKCPSKFVAKTSG